MAINRSILMSGSNIVLGSCNLVLTQPTIKQICSINEQLYIQGVSAILNIRDSVEGNSDLEKLSDFQILLLMVEQDAFTKSLLQVLFSIWFPNYSGYTFSSKETKITFFKEIDDKQEIVGAIEDKSFNDFQNVVRQALSFEEYQEEFKAANKEAQAIIDKIKKGRQATQSEQENDEAASVLALYLSVLSVGLPMDINTLLTYTLFQIKDIFQRYFAKTNSDYYTRVSTMPMMDASKLEEPEPWTRDLYK